MDFDPFKYTMDGIGVFAGELLRIFQRVCLNNDQTSGFIRERTGQHNPALRVEGLHLGEMRRAIDFSLGLPVGAVESENDEFHLDTLNALLKC